MARGINKVILVGNLGADPETRAMPSGTTVANLRIATSESWRDKQSGEQQERTEWHRVVLFGRLGEIAADDMQMLGGRGGGGAMGGGAGSGASGSGAGSSQGSSPGAGGGRGEAYPENSHSGEGSSGGGRDDFDDDIPF